MKNRILAFFIVLMLSFSLFAEKNVSFNRYRTETLGFSMGYGTYGLSFNMSAVTLRWEHTFWEILKLHYAYDFINSNSNKDIYALKLGTLVGVPFFLEKKNKHEIRTGGGVAVGASAYDMTHSAVDALLEISYFYHVSKGFAFQIGLGAAFPVVFGDEMFYGIDCRRIDGSKCYDSIYMPDIQGFIGVRF